MIKPPSLQQRKRQVFPLLRGPNAQDIRKLHAEVSQIANQRFLVNTVAISIFGVIVTWLIPKETLPKAGDPLGSMVFAWSFLLLLLLLLLYSYSHMLRRVVHTITTYLIVTNSSDWEQDWLKFRKHGRYWAYTVPQSILFMVLSGLASIVPVIFIFAYHLSWQPVRGLIALGIITFLYQIVILLMGFHSLWWRERARYYSYMAAASGA